MAVLDHSADRFLRDLRSILIEHQLPPPKYKIMKAFLVAACLIVLSPLIANAAVVSVFPTAPIVNILTGSSTPSGSLGLQIDKGSTTERFGGATFSLEAKASISAITLHLGAVGSSAPGKQASISLVSFTSFTSSSIAYNIKHTETVIMPNSSTLTAGNYITFSFSAPAVLEAGTYGILFRWIDSTSTGIRYSLATTNEAVSSSFRITGTTTPSTTYLIDGPEYFYLVQGTATTFYVSPSGNDSSSGLTTSTPVKTLSRAQQLVRSANANMDENITVYLRGGTYPITTPLTMTELDSGTNGHFVVWKAYPGEIPAVSGGVRVTNWTQNGNIWSAPISTNTTRQLYVNQERRQRARSADSNVMQDYYYNSSGQKAGIYVLKSHFPVFSTPQQIELHYHKLWYDLWVAVTDVTSADDTRYIFHIPTQTFGLNVSHVPDFKTGFVTENDLQYIDGPGEWVCDRTAGRLYYWPKPGENPNIDQVIIPIAEQLISISGGSPTARAHHIQFDGITFEHVNWSGVNGVGYNTVFSAFYHMPTAGYMHGGIQLNNTSNISIVNNHFYRFGCAGIGLGRYNDIIDIIGNSIIDMSDGGIVVGQTTQVAGVTAGQGINADLRIANNMVNMVGREYEGSVGIEIFASYRASVDHNHIEHAPYTGISMGWFDGNTNHTNYNVDNMIVDNRVESCMRVTEDGASIYTVGAQPNMLITGNYVKNALNFHGGIYHDQCSAFITTSSNVLEGISSWIYASQLATEYQISVFNNWSTTANYVFDVTEGSFEQAAIYPTAAWPAAAQTIIANAGLEVGYRGLLNLIPYPSTPQGPTAAGFGSTQINLAWSASDGATSYNIKRASTAGGPFATIATGVTGTTYSDIGLSAGATYYYIVRAVNTRGESTDSSQAMGSPTLPTIIDNTNATGVAISGAWTTATFSPGYYGTNYLHDGNTGPAGGKSVRFSPNLTTSGSYHVYLRWLSGTNRGSNVQVDINHTGGTTTCVVNQRVNNGVWMFLGTFTFNSGTAGSLLVRNDKADGYVIADAVAFAKVGAAPAAPSGLTATGGNAQVSLSWTASSGAISYNIKRATVSGGPYTTIASGVTATSYTNTGLANGTTYFYVVSAVNATGESPNSTQASVTILSVSVPLAPSGLTATAATKKVTVAWTDNASNAQGFKIERALNGTTFTQIATGTENTSSFANTGLPTGITYLHRVRAYNVTGDSTYSNVSSATSS